MVHVNSASLAHAPNCLSERMCTRLFGADVQILNPAESERSYSSVWDDNAPGMGHAQSMLDSAQAWSAQTNEVGQYMTISLGSVQTVTGVITQGRSESSQWVTSYKVQTSMDCSVYDDVDRSDRDSQSWVFAANVEMYSAVPNFFKNRVKASCVRLLPQSWVNHMSMRAGVIVSLGRSPSSLPPTR
jgi:hypothetical protein